jgi:hypothetical protein
LSHLTVVFTGQELELLVHTLGSPIQHTEQLVQLITQFHNIEVELFS